MLNVKAVTKRKLYNTYDDLPFENDNKKYKYNDDSQNEVTSIKENYNSFKEIAGDNKNYDIINFTKKDYDSDNDIFFSDLSTTDDDNDYEERNNFLNKNNVNKIEGCEDLHFTDISDTNSETDCVESENKREKELKVVNNESENKREKELKVVNNESENDQDNFDLNFSDISDNDYNESEKNTNFKTNCVEREKTKQEKEIKDNNKEDDFDLNFSDISDDDESEKNENTSQKSNLTQLKDNDATDSLKHDFMKHFANYNSFKNDKFETKKELQKICPYNIFFSSGKRCDKDNVKYLETMAQNVTNIINKLNMAQYHVGITNHYEKEMNLIAGIGVKRAEDFRISTDLKYASYKCSPFTTIESFTADEIVKKFTANEFSLTEENDYDYESIENEDQLKQMLIKKSIKLSSLDNVIGKYSQNIEIFNPTI